MNYLTNFYKNLCEQLQAKVNYLEQTILEGQKDTEDVIIDDAETEEGEYTPTLIGRIAKGKGAKRGRTVKIEPGNAIPGESKQTEIHHAVQLANGDADKNNIYTTGKAIKVNKSQMHKA